MASARRVALDALLRVEEDDGYSNLVLDKALSQSGLSQRDKALAAALFYGVLESRLTLDYVLKGLSNRPLTKLDPIVLEILRMGLYQLLYLDKIPSSAAVNESVKLAKAMKKFSASGFINGVLRGFIRSGCTLKLPDEDKNPLEYLSLKYSCPQWLVALWQSSYDGENAIGLLKALSGRPPLTLRRNPLRCKSEEFSAALEEMGVKHSGVTGVQDAYQIGAGAAVEQLPGFQDGWFHVQDLASQLCCLALDARPGQRVIDVCSAPGGKAFTVAELMENKGELLAFDLYENKMRLIEEGAKRLGLSIIKTGVRDAAKPESEIPPADRVLCDAPCSGLGILRRKPEIRYKKQGILDSLPDLQYLIVCESAKLVKPGGILVYSTCTLNPKENGEIAERFLREHPDFAAKPISLPGFRSGLEEPMGQLTLMPHLHATDGFFISAFLKKE